MSSAFIQLKDGKVNKNIVFIAISLCGIVAYAINLIYPPFDALILSLIFGIFLSSFFSESYKEIGEELLSLTLPVGIAMYGANIKLNAQIAPYFALAAVASAFILGTAVYFLSRNIFNLNYRLSILLSCGTAICGASAIAVVASLIKPKKEEFSAAVIVITIVGLTGAIVLPYLYHVLSFSSMKYALLCGATLHQTGLVEVATRPFGDNIVKSALEVKGVRIALIAVVAFFISLFHSKQTEHKYYVPWYIAAFLILSYLSSFILTETVLKFLKPISSIAFSITLASVGFSVNIRDIRNMRFDPLVAAYAGWVCAFLIIFTTMVMI